LKRSTLIGFDVFIIAFVVFLILTFAIPLLPPGASFDGIWNNIVNGLFYGFIAWILYNIFIVLWPLKIDPKKTPKILPTKPKVKEIKEKGIPLIKIEGIGPVYEKNFAKLNIKTTSDLLEAGQTPTQRIELAKKTGISKKLILEWVNLSDLFRIKGVGEEYSDLLEEAGVDTVVELARRNPENLHAKIVEVNEKKDLVRRTPTLEEVTNWIKQAKQLPRKVEY
jgi:predicted flap endonuclease-1-like 5' DNA nuclease